MANKESIKTVQLLINKALLISADESSLLKKMSAGDKVALFQLIMMNMPYIISCAQLEKNRGLPLTELIVAATRGFINAAEESANKYSPTADNMHKLMHRAIDDALKNISDVHNQCVKYYSPKGIAYLNKLNKLLKEKEIQIMGRVSNYLVEITQI